MRYALSLSLCFFAATTSLADQTADLEKMMAEMRARASEAGDVVALADYALKDFAEAQGFVDACDRSDSNDAIREMADRYGEWSKPGIWSWLTGAQSGAADSAYSFASLRYSTARLSAVREGCPRLSVSVQRMAVDTHKQIFDGYLALRP